MTAVVWPITKLIWTNWTSATSLKVLNRFTAHHDAPTASDAGVPALFRRGESVLVPTAPPVTELLTVSCLAVEVPGEDERLAVSNNLRKLATVHYCSRFSFRSRAGRVGQSNSGNQSNEGDHEENSTNDESSLLADFHRDGSCQINCRQRL